MTMMESTTEYDGPTDLMRTTEALEEDVEYTTRPRDWRQRQRWRGLDGGIKEYTTMTEASAEEDEHEDYNNNNVGVGGG